MEGFVAFLDLLGFKQAVLRPDFDQRASDYIGIVQESVGATSVGYALASDSVILTTSVNTDNEIEPRLLDLMRAACSITYRCLTELSLPVRGGIAAGSYGRIEVRDGGVLVAGPAVVDAYVLEQQQDWVGVTISPAVVTVAPMLREYLSWGLARAGRCPEERLRPKLLAWNKVARRHPAIPLHGGEQLDGFALVPHRTVELMTREDAGQLNREMQLLLGRLDEVKLAAPDARSQRKYDAARGFLGVGGRGGDQAGRGMGSARMSAEFRVS